VLGADRKNDRRDAELILGLLLKEEFPRVHRPSFESREVLRLLRYRHRLVQLRTMIKNSLHALALSAGLTKRSWLFGRDGRQRLLNVPASAASEMAM